jgi:diadenosine tetraphosphate (Ap4A) HIT family hydrolase
VAYKKVAFNLDELLRKNTSGRCFVCEYVRGNHDYSHIKVSETSHAVAFLNRYPTLFGSVIVASKAHREQVTGDFEEAEYLELQRFIYKVAEAMRGLLAPERIYILSLGSRAANSHVHWHLAPLPVGIPLDKQQYHALMHEEGVIEVSEIELTEYAAKLAALIAST